MENDKLRELCHSSIGHALTDAVNNARKAFAAHDLEGPTAMVVGEDVQIELLKAGLRPTLESNPDGGSWLTVYGVEIRGVSEKIQYAARNGLKLALFISTNLPYPWTRSYPLPVRYVDFKPRD